MANVSVNLTLLVVHVTNALQVPLDSDLKAALLVSVILSVHSITFATVLPVSAVADPIPTAVFVTNVNQDTGN